MLYMPKPRNFQELHTRVFIDVEAVESSWWFLYEIIRPYFNFLNKIILFVKGYILSLG